MATNRFHKAAKDGLIEILAEATRKDINTRDTEKMTPVMWAAFEGRLEALRLLCGRGGDPDKCDQFGNTSLHLAAARGHLLCVDFLVKFGVNIYALDIDKHSAKDLAAINNKDDILRYLDSATARFEAQDRKKAKALKELAEKNCEKRIREYIKHHQDHNIDIIRQETSKKPSSNMLSTLKQKMWSSHGNINKMSNDVVTPQNDNKIPQTKFSDLVCSGSSSSGSSTMTSRANTMQNIHRHNNNNNNNNNITDSGFKICEIEADGKRTVTSLTGLQRDSEVIYVGNFNSTDDNSKRGKISDVFEWDKTTNHREIGTPKRGYGILARSFTQTDILDENKHVADQLRETLVTHRSTGLFDRPTMSGSIAFKSSVSAALSQRLPDYESFGTDSLSSSSGSTMRASSTASRTKSRSGKTRLYVNFPDDSYSDDGDDTFSKENSDKDVGCPLQRFLATWGLEEYLSVFQKEKVDLSTLMLLTESDLKSLGLPLGPFRKILFAIQERRNALANPGTMQDSHL